MLLGQTLRAFVVSPSDHPHDRAMFRNRSRMAAVMEKRIDSEQHDAVSHVLNHRLQQGVAATGKYHIMESVVRGQDAFRTSLLEQMLELLAGVLFDEPLDGGRRLFAP